MNDRSAEFEHQLRNQVAIVVSYCELLLGDVPPDSPLRSDLLKMQQAAVAAMDMLLSTDPPNP